MPTQTFFNLPESKRNNILDLAIQEFAAHDYEQASISRLVARAGIAKGSLYQYFANKRDLYFYLLDLAAAEKRAFFQDHPQDAGDDTFAYLRQLFRAGLKFEFSRPELAQITYRAVYGGGSVSEAATVRLRDASAGFFRDLITTAQAEGQIDPAHDPELVAFLLNQVMTGFGNFLLQRLSLPAEVLVDDGAAALDGLAYWKDIDQLLLILQRGLQSPAA